MQTAMQYVRDYPVATTAIILFCVTATLLVLFDAPLAKSASVSVDGVEVYSLDAQRIALLSAAVVAVWYFWPQLVGYARQWTQ